MPKKYRITAILSTALLALTMTFSAAATIIPLTASLDGAQAGTNSTAIGSARMWFDDSTNDFSWDISWSALVGNITVAHFHGPALPGNDATVQVPISIASNPTTGSANLDQFQAADLLNGLWYINIHSSFDTSGEIRGQVQVPEPNLALLFLLSLTALWYRQTRLAK